MWVVETRRFSVKSLSVVSVLVLLLGVAGCGTGRRLLSITVSPISASPQPGASIQFSAIGAYSDGKPSVPPNLLWSIGDPFAVRPMVIIPNYPTLDSATGVAQCFPSGTFTVTVFASAPVDPNLPLSKMEKENSVSGTAQLSCP